MKIVFGLLLIAFCAASALAQSAAVVADFEKNSARYKLEKYVVGEDATSGYDYLVYTDRGRVVKVREVWSSLSYAVYRAEDYYFADGKLSALVKYTFPKRYYNAAKKGAKVPLKLTETLLLSDSKLTNWTENGKTVTATDPRWKETEKHIVENAGYILESYKNFLEEGN